MSLITEALRKARQEAVRQEALKSGSAYPFLVEPTPDRGRMRTYLILGALGVLLAAGLGAAGAVWLMSDRMAVERVDSDPRPAERVAQAAPAAPVPTIEEVPSPEMVAPEPEPILEAIAPEPRPERVVVPPPAAETVNERLAERPIQLREPAPRPETAEAPVSDPVLPAPAAPAPSAPEVSAAPQPSGPSEAAVAAGLENGKTFVREMPVPGGGKLTLNGIAFSENPVALFTDKVVSPGEEIQGFKVSKVEAGRVELQGHGVTVYVTVK